VKKKTQKKGQSKLLVIYGPTVTGKTSLAINLAKKYNGEIISADSRQVYKGLDIGSGKVSFASKVEKYKQYWIVDGVKIYGFDLTSPGRQFTVADFIKFASDSVFRISKSKKLPILVGGSGFYIKSFLYGLESIGVAKDEKFRKALSQLSANDLYKKLWEINPQKTKSLNQSDRKNPRRLIRAIEIAVSKKKKTNHFPFFNNHYLMIGLTAPNDFLFKKADIWLEERLEKGLVKEVRNLRETEKSEWLISLGLEYKWTTLFLEEKLKKQDAIGRLKGDIHSFIRRQKTWFKQFEGIKMYDISQYYSQNRIEKVVLNFVKKS